MQKKEVSTNNYERVLAQIYGCLHYLFYLLGLVFTRKNGHEIVYNIARLNGHQTTPKTICKVLAVHRARLAQVIREEMEATVL